MDRGWNVAAAASLTAFFTVVMMMNSGFFYVSFLEEFQVDRRSASWPNSVLAIVSHSSGLLVSLGQRYLSVFQLGLVGSIFLWVGILGAVVAPNIIWMSITLGGIHGVGLGIVVVTLILVVMAHFEKYRGVASGLKFVGYTLSSLLFPVILTSLKKAYGFKGCLLVYAALTMNVTALSLVLKEPRRERRVQETKAQCHTSTAVNSINTAISKNATQVVAVPAVADSCQVSYLVSHRRSQHFNSMAAKLEEGNMTVKPISENKTALHAEENGLSCCAKNTPCVTTPVLQPVLRGVDRTAQLRLLKVLDERAGTTEELLFEESKTMQDALPAENNVTEITEPALNIAYPPSQDEPKSRYLLKNILLLSKPRFCVFVLAIVAVDYTMTVFPVTIVDYALDKGSPRIHADLSVTYCAPAEIVGHIVLPLIADCGLVSRTTLASVSYFLLAMVMFALPVTSSFVAYILVCACATMLIGCLVSLKPVVIADHFGIECIAAGWGFAGVALLPLMLCSPTIIGYFRDTRGTYDGLYQMQAGIHFLVGGAFGVLAVLERRRRKLWSVK